MNAIPSETPEENLPQDDSTLAAVNDVEAGIRDFVRNDIAYLRRPSTSAAGSLTESLSRTSTPSDTSSTAMITEPLDTDANVKNVNSLIQRVAGTSLAEIEKLITELEGLRDLLHNEGQRVQREIAGYAHLSHAAMKSTRIIAENIAQWKTAAEPPREG